MLESPESPPELPQLPQLPRAGEPSPERADAVRNRRRILATAERLFAAEGVDEVSVDRIASEAGVGKGTVFRRFGDRAALLLALLSEREAAFQDDCIRGPAPLGPSADPAERLLAYGPAFLELIESHIDILRAAETCGAGIRFGSRPYAFHRAHLVVLLGEAAPDVDPQWAADALLALTSADLVHHQLRVVGLTREQLADGWRLVVRGLLER